MATNGESEHKWWESLAPSSKWRWMRYTLLGIPVVGVAALFIAGIVFWGGFNAAMEATNTLGFCISCHEMEDTVYQEYRKTVHYHNRTGVRATCSDCHVPDPWIHKVTRKIAATKEFYHKVIGSIDTPAKFEAKRLELARRVWVAMKETDSRECRNCHNLQSMDPEFQRPRARKQHLNAMKTGQTCIDCHKGIAHKDVRDLLAEEELERLEKPNPAHVRAIPEEFLEGLERAKAKEAEEAAKKKAAEEATKARIAQAVAAARAAEKKKVLAELSEEAKTPTVDQKAPPTQPSATQESSEGQQTAAAQRQQKQAGAPTSSVDWSGVEATTVTLFYPGQASFEWTLTGKDHGGARAFKKAGDRCAECHAQEVKDMGAKIVSGEKVEPTPIPGKRASIDLKIQAVHDGKNLHMRFQWPNAEHTPAPFVDGGKMDPDNQVKLAVMIAGEGIDKIEQAGCWATCHHDSRYMPHAPKPEDASASEAAQRIDVSQGITKYLPDSRTKVEIAGRRGKKKGGWDKLKPAEEIDALMKAGSYMDLVRFLSGGGAENGHVLLQRNMKDSGAISFTGGLEGDVWTAIFSRALDTGKPGDVKIEPGKIYTVGFAIHDDYTAARFHHVSLEIRMGLDNGEAEINVVKQ